MSRYLESCLSFLDKGVSPFHAVKEAADRLEKAGYIPLEESEKWDLKAGGKYFTTRNGSSIIAWRMSGGKTEGWRGTLSHSDNPTFRISAPLVSDPRFLKARVEEYGGTRFSTWMDRPLKVCGRIFIRTEKGVSSRLVETGPVFTIPTLCAHFDREGRKGKELNVLKDLQPIYGVKNPADEKPVQDTLLSLFAKEGEVVGYDLTLAIAEKATVIGLNGDLYMSQRIDDLAAAVTTLDGFLLGGERQGKVGGADRKSVKSGRTATDVAQNSGKNTKTVLGKALISENRTDIWAMFDNEEVGSSTRQGAAGSFLPDVMSRIEEAEGLTKEDAIRARANTLFLSVDNSHAVHPNYPEMSDLEHPVLLNGGIAIKLTANQKYTTSAQTESLFLAICEKAGVPTQVFHNRPDVLGGSTLGNILSCHVSVPMVDIGLPQLSMHSAMETAGVDDIDYMVEGVRAFYETVLTQTRDGNWTIR